MRLDVIKVTELAKEHGWFPLEFQARIGLASFKKFFKSQGHSARVNVYITKGTVGTCVKHPKRGKTQLFRKQVDMALLEKIFRNPRVHTGRGYRRRPLK